MTHIYAWRALTHAAKHWLEDWRLQVGQAFLNPDACTVDPEAMLVAESTDDAASFTACTCLWVYPQSPSILCAQLCPPYVEIP